MDTDPTILVAPLNWGLGHAARCIPIIEALLQNGFKVIIGSDGQSLLLLQKEFPSLESINLPAYNIKYSRNPKLLKWKLLSEIPSIKRSLAREHRMVNELVDDGKIHGIISDNRFGVRSKKVPSVFITHQLNVLSGSTTIMTSKVHQMIIKEFDACWVPDFEGPENLSGELGHLSKAVLPNVEYIGPLSRMVSKRLPLKYDLLAVVSGPEPQRSLFEQKIIAELRNSDYRVLIVRGVIEITQSVAVEDNITLVNFMRTPELERAFNESDFVLSRSGYTTIMDLAALGKRAFFVPTPGQFEQEYLARRLSDLGIAPSCTQEEFNMQKLNEVNTHSGFRKMKNPADFEKLFSLLKGK